VGFDFCQRLPERLTEHGWILERDVYGVRLFEKSTWRHGRVALRRQ